TTKEELVTQKEEMELKSTQSSTTAKLPLLKQENGNSFKPIAETTTDDAGTSTTRIPGPVTIEEKAKKKNDVKARSMLLMALPNEHLMTFNQYKDAKTLFAAIETRFGGNESTKKTQNTILKQLYEHFSATSTESLDSIFNRLQKLVSQLAVLGVFFSQEDLNLKFLRSLPSEWNTHVVVWRNKSDLDTMSLDDLYNNFKIVEQEVRGTTSLNTSNTAFVSSPSPNSTNEVPTVFRVSIASPQVSNANLSDATVYAFLANQPNGSQLEHEDLEQIHEDDLEEIDLKWQLALLSMRAKRFFQKTGKKITINESDTAGYEKCKVECFNSHKMGHFARECKPSGLFQTQRDIKIKDCEIVVLKSKLEEISKEKDALETKIDKFENASQSLDKLIRSQVTDNSKKGLGYVSYNAVPPPHTGRFSSPRIDLSYTGLPEFAEPSVQSYGVKPIKGVTQKSSVKISAPVKENNGAPLIEDWESNEEDEVKSPPEKERKIVEPSVDKVKVEIPKQNDKPARRPVKYAEMYKTQRLVEVLITYRLGVITIRGKGWPVNPKRNFQRRAAYNNRNFFKMVNTAKEKFNTARPNLAVLNDVRTNKGKAVKASAYWVWRSIKLDSASIVLKKHTYIDIEDQGYFNSGCSRYMTRNISYLTDLKEFDGRYVAFRGGAKGGKITGKGTIRTGKLDFEDVYFVKELQFNLFSVLQMCDKKNSVLFTDSECFVLSPDFKLADESHVLLKVPRKNNMYSVDMKNIVLKKDLTCLVAKATNDESMLCYRRLGHINFKNINKLVKDNLVRELPSKHFENDQTCVACLKEKQHKNKVLVVKPYFKTPYELFRGRTPALSFIRPFGYHVTILNTLYHLGKFDGKSDEGFFVGYSTNSDGPKWLFDIDTLTESMNYVPVIAGTNSNDFAGKGTSFDADLDSDNQDNDGPSAESEIDNQERPNDENSTKDINTVGPSINTASSNINTASPTVNTVKLSDDFFGADNDMRSLDGVELDISNIFTTYPVLTTPNTRINKDHLLNNVIGDIQSGVQTRKMTVTTDEQGFISAIYEEKTHVGLHTCLFTYYLSQEEPKRITNALKDLAWVEAMIEEEVYVCQPPRFEDPDYPDKVYKVERALYGLHHAPKSWYETLTKYLLDNGFRKGKIDQTLLIKSQKEDILLVQVYVDDIIFGSTKKELCTKFEKLMHHKFQMSLMGELTFFLGLQVKQKSDGIFIRHDKYVDEILRKFKYEDVKPASTPMGKEKALLKDSDGDDVDVHLYRSTIGSLMYLTPSRPDIMFAICTCAKFQVTPKVSHLHAVKMIFRYLKGQPKLGLWYPRDSQFDLVAYTDSDYARASLDRISTSNLN
nr:uncharacterized mitochondrial protein AtMg00810-like [Tanacetum cinerariifolium]